MISAKCLAIAGASWRMKALQYVVKNARTSAVMLLDVFAVSIPAFWFAAFPTSGLIQHCPHFPRELGRSERFLQKRRPAIDHTAPHYFVVSVTGHEQHPHLLSCLEELFDEWPSIHLGHNYISRNDVDAPTRPVGNCKGLDTVPPAEHGEHTAP